MLVVKEKYKGTKVKKKLEHVGHVQKRVGCRLPIFFFKMLKDFKGRGNLLIPLSVDYKIIMA